MSTIALIAFFLKQSFVGSQNAQLGDDGELQMPKCSKMNITHT